MALAIDKDDNIYVADTLNSFIRKIDQNGRVTTVAGTPGKEGDTDGAVTSAQFRLPSGIAVSDDGSIIYVADTGNHKIRKIENGQVTSIAGFVEESDEDSDPLGGFRDGAAANAMFNLPVGLTIAGDFIIVADSGNNRIRAVNLAGYVITVAGGNSPGDVDEFALESRLHRPMGVYWHENILYIADTYNNKIKIMPFDPTLYE